MTTTHTITTEQMLAARVWLRFPSLMGRELNWIATPRSSFITHAAWISTGVVDGKLTGTVVIAMSSGIYAYHGVPISTYGAFHRSARKGKAYHRLFKGHFTSSVVFRVPRARTTTTQVRTTAAERRALNNARLLGLAA